MSIQSQIDRINENVANTYSVLAEAGANMPQTMNTDNLSETAVSIKAVLYGKDQGLTDAQKNQARQNIGAQPVGEYALRSELVTPTTISAVSLLASNWIGEGNLYSQVVSIEGVTNKSQVDLTPSVEQLVIFYEKDLTFVTENDNGTVTVYAIGQKPENDYTIQVTIKEVVV